MPTTLILKKKRGNMKSYINYTLRYYFLVKNQHNGFLIIERESGYVNIGHKVLEVLFRSSYKKKK